MNVFEIVMSVCLGLGLSAACGFRVFVPMLGVSIAAQSGHLTLSEGMAWLGSPIATTVFAVATVIEIAGYYIPWIDNLLDSIAGPAAVVAGIVATAAVTGELSPTLRWSLAAIAGGGTAGSTKALSVVTRATSTVTTGGIGNFVVSTVELILSIITTILAMLLPIVAAIGVVCLLVFGGRYAWRFWRTRRAQTAPAKI